MTTVRPRLSLVSDDVIIQVDRLTFMVPVRRFQVEGTLLKSGYVSLATEYAMRLVRDSGELTPGELGAFLGFSDLETRTLVQELLLDGYLDATEDRVRLGARGERAFDPFTGEISLLDVIPLDEKVSLDLISFAPVDGPDHVRLPWIVEVEISNKEKAAAASKEGTEGFRANFGEWRDRRFRKEGNSPVRLHTLSGEVVPLGRSAVPMTIPIVYTPSQGEGVDPDFTFLRDRGRRDARKDLIEALNGAVRRIVSPGDHVEAAAYTKDWDGGVFLGPFRSPTTNPLAWLQMASQTPPSSLSPELSPSVRLGGSVTSVGFVQRLLSFLDGVSGPETEDLPIVWVPASHAAWGASADLLEVTRQIKVNLAPKAGIVLMPRSDADERSKRGLQRTYGGGRDGRPPPLFDTCVVMLTHRIPQSLELIIQPGLWAVVLLHIPSRDGFPIPIGYATRNKVAVDAIGRTLAEGVTNLTEAAVAWCTPNARPDAILHDLERVLAG